MNEDDLEQLLDGVWQRRRAELLERVTTTLEQLGRAGVGDAEAWLSVGHEAHRLTGALGSLGFAEQAAAAGRLELAVQGCRLPDGELHDAARTDLERLYDELSGTSQRPR